MKNLKNIHFLIIVFSCLILSSCTKNFESINTDPNRPKDVNPGVILGQMQYRIVNNTIGASKNFTHELMQVDAPRSSISAGVHRYYVTEGSGLWSSLYTYITDMEDIITLSDKIGEKNYKAIALVYKCWAYSILTDLYGSVPYSEAIKATSNNFLTKFDNQKDIYIKILNDLVTANGLFDDTKALTYGGDYVYASNALTAGKNIGIQKWKKFSNTLRLRLLLRISKRQSEIDVSTQIKSILADPIKYPVFDSNADECIYRYPNTNPYYNPYYTARQLDWRNEMYYTKFFINKMNTDNDPRRAIWALPVLVGGVNVYQGIETGYPTTTSYVVGQNSSYTDALKTSSNLGVMMTYAEEEFIKAELVLKGYVTGKTSKVHYENGITASMIQWGTSLPANYLTQAGVVYNEAATADAQLQQIMLQKYYAFYFVDYQSWFEKIRTGYPVLARGTGIPAENLFPVRVPYPSYLQSLNPANYAAGVLANGGKDDSNTVLWWAK